MLSIWLPELQHSEPLSKHFNRQGRKFITYLFKLSAHVQHQCVSIFGVDNFGQSYVKAIYHFQVVYYSWLSRFRSSWMSGHQLENGAASSTEMVCTPVYSTHADTMINGGTYPFVDNGSENGQPFTCISEIDTLKLIRFKLFQKIPSLLDGVK